MTNNDIYRQRRIVKRYGSQINADVAVLVGLYNASGYLEGLIKQIEGQSLKNTKWYFFDNNSEDSTFDLVDAWLETGSLNAVLVKNEINLGATGSYFTNLDLIEANWITFFHQDDFYKPKFIEILWNSASNVSSDTVLVYGDMGRIDERGKNLGSYPSSTWMLPDYDPKTLFLALIRNHCVPWPAMMVRRDVFEKVEPIWHSAAFPDTEATLKMAAHGSFLHIPIEIMKYRDNLSSESRSLLDSEREFASALGLIRVFNSREFVQILELVKTEERANFLDKLVTSIQVRITNRELSNLVSTVAVEQADTVWVHSSSEVFDNLANFYQRVGSTNTVDLLERLSSITRKHESDNTKESKNSDTFISVDSVGSRRSSKKLLLSIYSKFGGQIPHAFRIRLYPFLISVISRNNQLSAWNFRWR